MQQLLQDLVGELKELRKDSSSSFEKINARLDHHESILNQYTQILNQHTEILNQHTKILLRHEKKLDEHNRMLTQQGDLLTQLIQMVGENNDQTKLNREDLNTHEHHLTVIDKQILHLSIEMEKLKSR